MARGVIIANCQGEGIARCLAAMGLGLDLKIVRPGDIKTAEIGKDVELVLLQDEIEPMAQRLVTEGHGARLRIVRFPTIYFTAFHPDFVYVRQGKNWLNNPIANANSAIIVRSWQKGFSVDETVSLFNSDVFHELGYFDHWQSSEEALLQSADKLGMDLHGELEEWRRGGCFVHCPNHPKLPPLAGIARAIVDQLGVRPSVRYPENLLGDQLATNLVWPVYPEIAEAFGFRGEYIFRGKDRGGNAGEGCFDLNAFVQSCFAQWDALPKSDLVSERLNDPRLERLGAFRRHRAEASRPVNPYAGAAPYRRWKQAVVARAPADVDPVVSAGFRIGREDRVATAGSCFAQHIARSLSAAGYRYYNVENGKGLPKEEAIARNFGVFSARFGNIYTARQLLQLFERSEGHFTPRESAWQREDGRFVDPFRPLIEPEGFASAADVETARETHFAFVQQMWRKSNVFVFTLGLTEAWQSIEDGAVFPVAPGVNGGSFDPRRHAFCNFSVEETVGDLREFLAKLRVLNPTIRVILTVSPVPLIATAEDQHVLSATVYSKSVLRVAAEQIARTDRGVDYFPSFEIVTGSFNRGAYFEDDLRGVRPEGVAHVMRVFMKHYSDEEKQVSDLGVPASESGILHRAELRSGRSVVCDEEEIERSIAQ